MVIVVGGVKGGSGKTTVATTLAVMRAARRRDLLLIDADRQGTAADFSALRDDSGAAVVRCRCVHLAGRAFDTEAPRLVRKYDDVVIDTDGQDVETQAGALALADVLLVPFVPRAFDFWTLDRVVARVQKARTANRRLRACAFLNRVDVGRRAADDAAELLGESGVLEVLPVRLGSRRAFATAASQGLIVTELGRPDVKASAEASALYASVFGEPAIPAAAARPTAR
jgi:chromosome partitioning protein